MALLVEFLGMSTAAFQPRLCSWANHDTYWLIMEKTQKRFKNFNLFIFIKILLFTKLLIVEFGAYYIPAPVPSPVSNSFPTPTPSACLFDRNILKLDCYSFGSCFFSVTENVYFWIYTSTAPMSPRPLTPVCHYSCPLFTTLLDFVPIIYFLFYMESRIIALFQQYKNEKSGMETWVH